MGMKKMKKTKKSAVKVNKTEEILKVDEALPAKLVVQTLAKRRIKVSEAYVHVVRYQARKRNGAKPRKPGRPRKDGQPTSTHASRAKKVAASKKAAAGRALNEAMKESRPATPEEQASLCGLPSVLRPDGPQRCEEGQGLLANDNAQTLLQQVYENALFEAQVFSRKAACAKSDGAEVREAAFAFFEMALFVAKLQAAHP